MSALIRVCLRPPPLATWQVLAFEAELCAAALGSADAAAGCKALERSKREALAVAAEMDAAARAGDAEWLIDDLDEAEAEGAEEAEAEAEAAAAPVPAWEHASEAEVTPAVLSAYLP